MHGTGFNLIARLTAILAVSVLFAAPLPVRSYEQSPAAKPQTVVTQVIPRLHQRAVVLNDRELPPVRLQVSAGRSGKSYPGFGVENSLDGDPWNNYTAFYQDSEPFFELKLQTPVKSLNGTIVFLSGTNYAKKWQIDALDESGKEIGRFVQSGGAEQNQQFTVSASQPIHMLRFSFSRFHGQPRLLLRDLALFQPQTLPENAVIRLLYFAGANLQCRSLKMDFSNCSYRPSVISAKAADVTGKYFYRSLFSVAGNTAPVTDIPVNKPFTFILIEMAKFRPGGCFDEVPKIDFRFDPEQERELAEDRELHKKIILAADDPANPLSIIRQPVTEYYRHLADKLIRKSGKKAPTDFEKVMIFMDHICRINGGYAFDSSPFGTLHERIGACGAVSFALNALSAASGIRCRNVNLCNFPENCAHSVTEQFIDGKWLIFDPTYGIYYKNAKTGEIMSFEELRNPANRGVPVCINPEKYAQSGESVGWGTQRAYLHSDPAGPIGPDHPMIYPEKLTWPKRTSATPPDLAHQGADYLGVAMVNANQEWLIDGLQPGKKYQFAIISKCIGGDTGEEHFVFTAQVGNRPAETFRLHRDRLKPVEIRFTADAPQMKIRLIHAYRGPKFHYLQIRQYQLSELKN
ncbi:MAG: transglutaminase domain-containing protein [Lentisphaeria bacterium]|nr:transglutaminase domain-containing protein [Lentisphaeria bacterium]